MMLTVFGYSGPATDAEAVKRFGEPWRTNKLRMFHHLEVIDVVGSEEVSRRWGPLAFQDHLLVAESFERSFLGRYPRRSCEMKRTISSTGRMARRNPMPVSASFDDLDIWLAPLVGAEAERR